MSKGAWMDSLAESRRQVVDEIRKGQMELEEKKRLARIQSKEGKGSVA